MALVLQAACFSSHPTNNVTALN